jgi:hypothetical protein
MLPDSNQNEPKSHGYISLSIKPKKELSEKTRVENFADIFFDFNEPVRTNTTFNTIYDMPAIIIEEAKLTAQVICHKTNISMYAGAYRAFCEKDTVILQAATPFHGKGKWKLLVGKGKIEEPANPNSLVRDLAFGTNVFEWSISANTCGTDSLKATVSITRLAKPTTPLITQIGADSLHCSILAADYEWQLHGKLIMQNSQRIHVTEGGTYTVRVTGEQGCNSDVSSPFVYLLTGIATDVAALVKIFPNPTNGRFVLSLPTILGQNIEVSIVDALGRRVFEQKIILQGKDEVAREIDLSAVPIGMYMIRITTQKGLVIKKIFKK